MKLLKDRKIALLIAVVIALAATVFGVHRSLNKLAREIENMFYEGVYLEDEGYTQASIYDHLNNQINHTLGAATIAQNYPELSEDAHALLTAREMLANALNSDAELKMRMIRETSVQMRVAFKQLYVSIAELSVSERDSAAFEQYFSSFNGAQTVIESNAYNRKVIEFTQETCRAFPVVFLKPFAAVKGPPLF